MIRDGSRAVEYLTDKDLTLSGRFAKALFQGKPIDQITLEYSAIENFKILSLFYCQIEPIMVEYNYILLRWIHLLF